MLLDVGSEGSLHEEKQFKKEKKKTELALSSGQIS